MCCPSSLSGEMHLLPLLIAQSHGHNSVLRPVSPARLSSCGGGLGDADTTCQPFPLSRTVLHVLGSPQALLAGPSSSCEATTVCRAPPIPCTQRTKTWGYKPTPELPSHVQEQRSGHHTEVASGRLWVFRADAQ